MGLFEQALVVIDGSKFKAVNNRDRNFTPHKLKARQQQLEQSISRYLTELDRADRDPSLVPEERVEHLKEKIATVRKRMRKLKMIGQELSKAPRNGGIPEQIIAAAEEWNADLIVTGHRGKGLFERWLLGSVSRLVIAYARCAVIVIR